jgi:hypothetical protein
MPVRGVPSPLFSASTLSNQSYPTSSQLSSTRPNFLHLFLILFNSLQPSSINLSLSPTLELCHSPTLQLSPFLSLYRSFELVICISCYLSLRLDLSPNHMSAGVADGICVPRPLLCLLFLCVNWLICFLFSCLFIIVWAMCVWAMCV